MKKVVINPFKNRDAREVWDEIRRSRKPITTSQALAEMRELEVRLRNEDNRLSSSDKQK